MKLKKLAERSLDGLRIAFTGVALFQFSLGGPLANAQEPGNSGTARTPIKHVIVIIGENRSFDHVFATYVPKNGQTVWNLLSEGIVNSNGTPGPSFRQFEQKAASDTGTDPFLLNPAKNGFPNNTMPPPLVGGAKDSYIPNDNLQLAMASENGLPQDYYPYLVSGGTGLTSKVPDTRINGVTSTAPYYSTLKPGPFQLTNGKTFVYNSYAASPVHRFYQMWQQLDCGVNHISWENPSGCDAALFSWVETTVGAGANGLQQPSGFTTYYSPSGKTTGEGSTALGFYNVQEGDAPYFKSLADNFSMSDNFHQSVNGGTGANHIMLGHGDAIWFSDGKGNAAVPPRNVEVAKSTKNGGIVDEVENPNPAPGTNNWYTEDGYGGGSFGSPSYGGGSYSNCSDPNQPGVYDVVKYLQSLPHPVDPHCELGHYYLLNNYNPGYFGNGNNAFTDPSPNNTVFTIPPSAVRSIGDELLEKNISWKYYGDQWNNYVPDPYQINYGAVGSLNPLGQKITASDEYCNICNPFQYDTSIMANPKIRNAHIQDTANLYTDIANGTLPAVSFVKPSGFVDGHPSSSKLNLFEGFAKKIVDAVQANPALWKDTAIFITFDEGGGYYDSGYVQPLDFFGDGTRIPLILVSPYAKQGYVSHDYSDHVSILKFIERNWGLPPVTYRSRDNFPNPIVREDNPYVPLNSPAIGDLFDLFDFSSNCDGICVP
jgi:phospholipase C